LHETFWRVLWLARPFCGEAQVSWQFAKGKKIKDLMNFENKNIQTLIKSKNLISSTAFVNIALS